MPLPLSELTAYGIIIGCLGLVLVFLLWAKFSRANNGYERLT
jgi:hypothetical protein